MTEFVLMAAWAILFLFWGVATLISILNSFTADRLHFYSEQLLEKKSASHASSGLSILMPVRNERTNLATTLPALFQAAQNLHQQGIPIEILIFDDDSNDGSDQVIEAFFAKQKQESISLEQSSGTHFQLLKTTAPLAPGWTGKNAACERLQSFAQHDHLLFIDADVTLGQSALLRAWNAFHINGCDALTLLPFQKMQTALERMLIPLIMHLSLFALLPLRSILKSPYPSLSVLNGQFILISKSTYRQVGRHEAVRASALEDVELGRLLKSAGFRLHALTAPGDVFVRMYESREALWEGFGKNLAPLLGGKSVLLAVLNTLAFTWVLLAPHFLPFFAPIFENPLFHGLPLMGLIACRLIIAREFRYPTPALDLLLHPAASLGFFVLALSSIVRRIQKKAQWKGRYLNP